MANTTATVNVAWRRGQSLIAAGTPLDSAGNIANNSDAYGIVAEDLNVPNRTATVITAGEWDEDYGYSRSGIALSDEAKIALSSITFKHPPVVYLTPEDVKPATTEKAGVVKMAASVADSEEETAPTTAEFNGLLAALRTSGALETPEEPEEDPEE